MNDGIRFKNVLEWKKFNEMGTLVDQGLVENTVTQWVKSALIDVLDAASGCSAIAAMALGTSSGATVWDTVLKSSVTVKTVTQSQTSSTWLQNVALFSGYTGTVTEAGLFGVSSCSNHMYFYNDGLNVALTATDSLQITWTVKCT